MHQPARLWLLGLLCWLALDELNTLQYIGRSYALTPDVWACTRHQLVDTGVMVRHGCDRCINRTPHPQPFATGSSLAQMETHWLAPGGVVNICYEDRVLLTGVTPI